MTQTVSVAGATGYREDDCRFVGKVSGRIMLALSGPYAFGGSNVVVDVVVPGATAGHAPRIGADFQDEGARAGQDTCQSARRSWVRCQRYSRLL